MPETEVPGLHVDEVDGVRVLWREVPGPLHAHLVLRGGQADETLPQHGISHLVEHLVLSHSNLAPHAYNASTGTLFTTYVMVGTPEQVVDHMGRVSEDLGDLPTDRLDHEKQVLQAEAAQRGSSPADAVASWRWGPLGFGLTAFEEFGIRTVGADEATAWSARFGADQAVLWLSGPPPKGLRLPLPPRAVELPPPPLVSPASPTPGSFPLGARGVTFTVIGARTPAAPSAVWLLAHRLEQRLRHELGLIYGVSTGTDLLAADARLIAFRVDCLEENSAKVQEEVARVLQDLGRPATDTEWATMLSHREVGLQAPAEVRSLQLLDTAAQDLLLGRPPVDPDAWEADVLAASREEVRDYLVGVLPSLVIGVSEPGALPADLATPLPLYSTERVDGTVLKPSAQHPDKRVRSAIVGRQGATIVFDGGDSVTVRSNDVAGALCWSSGARHLLGNDGFHVRISPDEWQGAAKALAELDLGLSPDVRIPAVEQGGEPEAEPVPSKKPRSQWGLAVGIGIGLLNLVGGLGEGNTTRAVLGGTVATVFGGIAVYRSSRSS